MQGNDAIELRAVRTFGEVIGDTFTILRHSFRVMGKSLIFIAGPPLLIMAIISGLMNVEFMDAFSGIMAGNQTAANNAVNTMFGAKYFITILLNYIVFILLQLITYEYLVLYTKKDYREITVSDVWNAIKKDLWMIALTNLGLILFSVISILILAAVAGILSLISRGLIAIPIILIFLLGIYFIITLSFVPVVRINERAGFFKSFGRSIQLMYGHWWSTLWIVVIMFIIMMALTIVLAIPYYILFTVVFLHKATGGAESQLIRILFIATSSLYLMGYLFYVLPMISIAFQYFSSVEKKEGSRLLERIDEVSKIDG